MTLNRNVALVYKLTTVQIGLTHLMVQLSATQAGLAKCLAAASRVFIATGYFCLVLRYCHGSDANVGLRNCDYCTVTS